MLRFYILHTKYFGEISLCTAGGKAAVTSQSALMMKWIPCKSKA